MLVTIGLFEVMAMSEEQVAPHPYSINKNEQAAPHPYPINKNDTYKRLGPSLVPTAWDYWYRRCAAVSQRNSH